MAHAMTAGADSQARQTAAAPNPPTIEMRATPPQRKELPSRRELVREARAAGIPRSNYLYARRAGATHEELLATHAKGVDVRTYGMMRNEMHAADRRAERNRAHGITYTQSS